MPGTKRDKTLYSVDLHMQCPGFPQRGGYPPHTSNVGVALGLGNLTTDFSGPSLKLHNEAIKGANCLLFVKYKFEKRCDHSTGEFETSTRTKQRVCIAD